MCQPISFDLVSILFKLLVIMDNRGQVKIHKGN